MSRPLRRPRFGGPEYDLDRIRIALLALRDARDIFVHVGARRAAAAVRRALKSAEGAERHALRLCDRNQGRTP